MSLWKQTSALIKREFLQEQRQKYALFGVLLYVISTIFIGRFSFKTVNDVPVWNALFWTILLFSTVIGVARSFNQETRGRLLYLYFMADPRAVLLSKTIYNVVLMLLLGTAGYLFYSILIGNLVQNVPFFFAVLAMGCTGLAISFTMISAIASRAGNNFTLMSILGFPVIIPMLLLTIRLSKIAADGTDAPVTWTYFEVLAIMNVLVFALAWILFPFLWRD